MVCYIGCDNCYPLTGLTPTNMCGCNCDPCKRCCGINKCPSFTEVRLVGVGVSDLNECFASPSPFAFKKNKNPYDIFFNRLKFYIKKQNIIKKSQNPILNKVFDFLKTVKIFFNYKNLNFKNKVYSFFDSSNKKKWFYKKNKFYQENYYNKKNNYVYWDGNNWHFLKLFKKIDFKKLKNVPPFYLVFNNNFDVLHTTSEILRSKFDLKKIIKDYDPDFFIQNKNFNLAESEKISKFIGKQKSIDPSSCDCTPRCYYVNLIYTRSGDGCGFCSATISGDPNFRLNVGGGCTNVTCYDDGYVAFSLLEDAFSCAEDIGDGATIGVTNFAGSGHAPCFYPCHVIAGRVSLSGCISCKTNPYQQTNFQKSKNLQNKRNYIKERNKNSFFKRKIR